MRGLRQCKNEEKSEEKHTSGMEACFAPFSWRISGLSLSRPVDSDTCWLEDIFERSLLRDRQNH